MADSRLLHCYSPSFYGILCVVTFPFAALRYESLVRLGNESFSTTPLNGMPIVDAPTTEDRVLGTVIDELAEVFRSRELVPPPLDGNTILDASLGLESLDFAEWVVRREQALGKDPFS